MAHLARIAAAPAPIQGAVTVAILTGQIDLRVSPLSPAQSEFLAALEAPAQVLCDGFPYEAKAEAPTSVGMVAASWRNARQYLWAHHDDHYRGVVQERLAALADASRDALVLITGSCGLAIAAAGLCDRVFAAKTWIFALGPVGTAPRGLAGFRAVQGRQDGWSRALYRGPPARMIDCGHLGYWRNESARALARDFIATPCRL
jgi:hypothetical protein